MCNYRLETNQGKTRKYENSIDEIGPGKVLKSNHHLKVYARVSWQKRFLRHESLNFCSCTNLTCF